MEWSLSDGWVMITAVLCAVACALPGCFLVLRKMSMMGDAISHAVLPGLVVAFLVTGSRTSFSLFIGAAVIGVLTAVFTQWISRFGQVDRGASMGIVFTSLFALGLILIAQFADHVDLDPGCVLYGAIEFVPLDLVSWFGYEVPRAVGPLLGVLLTNLFLITLFYKELRLCSFDANLANTIGFPSQALHYLLMIIVAITTMACFEAVGSIIVIAMLIVPAATALLLTRRLFSMLIVAAAMGSLAALLGHLGATGLPLLFDMPPASTSGMIAVCSGGLFALVWAGTLIRQKWSEKLEDDQARWEGSLPKKN